MARTTLVLYQGGDEPKVSAVWSDGSPLSTLFLGFSDAEVTIVGVSPDMLRGMARRMLMLASTLEEGEGDSA